MEPNLNGTGSAFQLKDFSEKMGMKLFALVFDLPGEKVNKLSKKVMEDFNQLLPELESLGKQGKIEALVLMSGKKGNFCAGADLEMVQTVKNPKEAEELSRTGQKMADRWEDLPFPTIAVIDGAALGGGCELALACSAIVMSNDPTVKLGLPECLLGLIPGMGGCIRLPGKVGLATAFDLILAGKTLNGERAYKAGLIEACIPKENFEEFALKWVKQNVKAIQSGKRLAKEPKLGGMGGALGSLMEKTMAKNIVFKKAREGVLSKTKGHYPAPLEVIEVMQTAGVSYGEKLRGKQRDAAMALEAKGFGKMACTEVSKNLIRLFFMTEGVKKSKGILGGDAKTVREKSVRSGAVLGAGVMGGGISQLFADRQIPTRMKDLNQKALALGVQAASKLFAKQVQRKRMTSRQMLQKLNLIAPTEDYSGFDHVDVVVEAIVENIDIKMKVLQELESHVAAESVIASNTSSLSISKMQTALKNPGRFVGMHFFNPVNKMPLIEVIRGEKSTDEAVSTIYQLSKKLGKTPIVVKDSPGFLVNRLLLPYLNESVYLLLDGVPVEEIDRVFLEFGMPMGPMELIDEVGVDVGEKVSHILYDAFGKRMEPAPVHGKIVKSGRLGKKSGQGIYRYEGPKKEKQLDPKIYELIGATPKTKSDPKALKDEEILDRCILPMINEAARCLEEGVVGTAAEVDLGMIMGTGFPPFRGGLLQYADTVGLKTLVEKLRKYEARFGARYEPAPALLKRMESGQKFYSTH